ncbi:MULTISPECIES: ABC transporter permease [Halomicrobium]|uniref:Binding-protein-dependent transport systems inner membrane component n=2 Tax=Halomicrobium mukohataei TaxID=57705 RepID=C7NWY7_HALMD|nr:MULTISPECIES: ABC transporter permease [Halomicrobium]ACV46352.1 binding-protein-dependent transport systems inner membrane component [Halomicrobium mukohataei DSM 12286]QCD64907.1 ABC transporter permease [Halomicrobium mukohataei]QFR19713.1 ABC transporter permease subunit [Halomicrobium sp. ZPS1]
MSTETRRRGAVDRLRASPFLSKLLSNRLALVGLTIILGMLAIALYARITLDPQALASSRLGTAVPDRAPPGWTGTGPADQYLFGTDSAARDIYERCLYGAWLALQFGTITVGTSTVVGVGLGIVAAYYGDVTDNVVMRTMDVLLAFPPLLLALALVAIFPRELGLWRAVAALTLVYTPRFARVIRGAALTVLEDEYVDATVALGATDPRVLVRHVLPNTLAPITVQSTLNFGLAIIDLAALSFLGFGAQAGTPSWGLMLSRGVDNGLLTGRWWLSFFPGLFLAVTVLGFNLLGDGMRDALDPRMREAID